MLQAQRKADKTDTTALEIVALRGKYANHVLITNMTMLYKRAEF